MKPSTPGKSAEPKPADKSSTAQAFDDALAAEQEASMNVADSSEVERLRIELGEAKDRDLRTQAELDNYRKRVQREMEDSLRYANMNLMRDLLPVVDNLNRAADSAEKTSDVAGLLAGVKMVAAQFEDVLARHHCKRITAHGETFDPNVHEAIAQQPSEEHPQGMVLLEATTGFQLHDRVVRPTQVIVSSGPANS
jgi:molecular chaperone GrpE